MCNRKLIICSFSQITSHRVNLIFEWHNTSSKCGTEFIYIYINNDDVCHVIMSVANADSFSMCVICCKHVTKTTCATYSWCSIHLQHISHLTFTHPSSSSTSDVYYVWIWSTHIHMEQEYFAPRRNDIRQKLQALPASPTKLTLWHFSLTCFMRLGWSCHSQPETILWLGSCSS